MLKSRKFIDQNHKVLLLIIFIVIIGALNYWLIADTLYKDLSYSSNLEQQDFPSDRSETFSISGGKKYPIFYKEIIIDPAASPVLSNIKPGERQTYSIWVQDPDGIDRVIAIIKTDKRKELIEMQLVEGDKEGGRWMGSWITGDIYLKESYRTTFRATNTKSEHTKISIPWYIEKEISKERALEIVSEKYPAKFYSAERTRVLRLIGEETVEIEVWKVKVDLLEEPIMSPLDDPCFKIEVIVNVQTGDIDIYKMYD